MMEWFLFLAGVVLCIHLFFNIWVVFGAAVTAGRPALERLHLISLFYGAVMENIALPCPLTVGQKWLLSGAGRVPYRGGFVLHYLQAVVAPQFPLELLRLGAIGVLLVNLGIYTRRHVHAARHAFHH